MLPIHFYKDQADLLAMLKEEVIESAGQKAQELEKRWHEEFKLMANQQQLDLLKQGEKNWNQWRKEYPHIQIDLTKCKVALRAELIYLLKMPLEVRHTCQRLLESTWEQRTPVLL